jgi:hypothetical protein
VRPGASDVVQDAVQHAVERLRRTWCPIGDSARIVHCGERFGVGCLPEAQSG